MGNIGIMGGTFDPIHNGHLFLGKQAYQEYGLDQIWYMPSGRPPHKKDHKVTDGSVRLQMVELSLADQKGFVCSDFEVKQEGSTYTAKTLKLLKEAYPHHVFYFIIGADSLYEIETWYQPQRVMASAVILVAPRRYDEADKPIQEQIAHLTKTYHSDIRMLHGREIDLSSAMLRSMVARGEPIDAYVPAAVASYIRLKRLYREE